MADSERGRRVAVRGVVKSDKMDKTIVVEVKRQIQHPRFRKYIRRSTSYYAHDAKNEAQVGDLVEIVQTKPMSKLKRWRLAKVLTAGGGET